MTVSELLKLARVYIILHFLILLFMTIYPLLFAQCAVRRCLVRTFLYSKTVKIAHVEVALRSLSQSEYV